MVQLAAEGCRQLRRGAGEAHRQQDQIGRDRLVGAGPLDHLRPGAGRAGHPVDLVGLERLHVPLRVTDDAARAHQVAARVGAPKSRGLLLSVVHLVDLGPLRPGVVRGPRLGRAGKNLELDDAPGALANGRADAVRAGVAAADDHDVAPFGRDSRLAAAQEGLGAGGQVLHGEVDAGQLPPRDGQVARDGGAHRQDHRVEVGHELRGLDVTAHGHPGPEGYPLSFQELDAALDDALVQLHVGDAVRQQPADAVVALEDRDLVAGAVELGRDRQAGWAAADHGDLEAGAGHGRLRHDPAFAEGAVDDLGFDGLDRHRLAGQAHGARTLARRGADAAGELGEVVGLVEADDGLAPLTAVDQVVPLGNDVVDRAAQGQAVDQFPGMAIGDTAVHAASALPAQGLLGVLGVGLAPVLDPLQGRADVGLLAVELHEAGRLAHRQFPATRRASRTFSSKAAISASSGESPLARMRACASSTRR